MKSRKLKAVLAALSAIAVLATAMTGFAAATVTTETKYNCGDNYAQVKTTVSGLSKDDAEVTLRVSAGGGLGVSDSGYSYIDQKTAEGDTAVFEYSIDKTLVATATAVTVEVGSDTEEEIAAGKLGVVAASGNATYYDYQSNDPSIAYVGNAETVTVPTKFTAAAAYSTYQIDRIYVNGTSYYGFNAVPVVYTNGIPALPQMGTREGFGIRMISKAQETYTLNVGVPVDNGDNSVTTVVFLSESSGSVQELGIIYDGVRYPSVDKTAKGAAITLVPAEGDTIDTSKIEGYYMLDNVCYGTDGAAIGQ